MTKQELNRFQAVLTARTGELERLIAFRDTITIERSSDERDQMQRASELALAVSNLDRESSLEMSARPCVVLRKAALGRARSVSKTFTRSGSRRCRGQSIVSAARNSWNATLRKCRHQPGDILANAA
jgi:hypothetical protein